MIIMELIVNLEFFVAGENSHRQVLFPFIFQVQGYFKGSSKQTYLIPVTSWSI